MNLICTFSILYQRMHSFKPRAFVSCSLSCVLTLLKVDKKIPFRISLYWLISKMPEKISQEGISGHLTQWIQKPTSIPRVVVLVPIKANSTRKGNVGLHQAQQWPFSIPHTRTSVRPQEVISFQVFSRNMKDWAF